MDKALVKMDEIALTGMRYYGYTGYFTEEQVLGQWFEVDLILWLDLLVAGKSDRLEDTLDYRQAIDGVRQLVETSKFKTIEYLAAAIARTTLNLERVQKVKVRVTKVSPPIPDFRGQIAVELIREKDDSF